MSTFDNLFRQGDGKEYRDRIRSKLEEAYNTAKNAQSDVERASSSSKSDLQGPVYDVDTLLCDLRIWVPIEINEGAKRRHDTFNDIVKSFNNVAERRRPLLPAARKRYDEELEQSSNTFKADLTSLLDDIIAWLDDLLK